MKRTGVLLINIGTPDEPTPEAVGRYLREFLMDEYVLDMPFIKRWLLVNRVIVPRRKAHSAAAYQNVQTVEGPPLMANTRVFSKVLAAELGNEYVVEIGMRYGNPSIRSALEKLHHANVDRIVVAPLYPQYTQSSFESALVATKKHARSLGLFDKLSLLEPFYADRGFIQASALRVSEHLREHSPDHVLFSFHGVPARHVKQLDASGQHCLGNNGCCDSIQAVNQNCYRAQCIHTARAIADELGLPKDRYTTCFQSQFGKDEWIKPSLVGLLNDLPTRGVRRIAVFCPSFVADCLETLEEIGIRGSEDFIAAGGDELTLIPCLNSDPLWVKAAANLIVKSARDDRTV